MIHDLLIQDSPLHAARRLEGPRRRDCAGFTLIELLIVISILGILAAVLIPALLPVQQTAEETSTKALMLRLEDAAKKFSRETGMFPSDDFSYLDKNKKVDWKKDNGRNTGIESFVCIVSQDKRTGTDLSGVELCNADGDTHGEELPMLRRRDRPEIADSWGAPIAYFSKLGMDRPQQMVLDPESDPVTVKAKRRDDGTYFGQGKYQFLSAGKDGTFGTDDDLVWPEN